MERHQIGSGTLLPVVIAGILPMLFPGVLLGWLTPVIGIALLLILFAYDQEGRRSILQSIAFSGAAAFPLVLILNFALHLVSPAAPAAGQDQPDIRGALLWALGTLVLVIVDRIRAGDRVSVPAVPANSYGLFGASGQNTAVSPESTRPAPAPGRVAQAPVPQPALFTPAAAVAASEPDLTPFPTEDTILNPVPVPGPIGSLNETAVYPAMTPPTPAGPLPATAPIPRRGKEVSIYVNLVDEGLNVLRPVRAEDLGHGYYMIVEEMPDGENWQFKPGQVVRCEKKKLSTGKALVATQEAPRAS